MFAIQRILIIFSLERLIVVTWPLATLHFVSERTAKMAVGITFGLSVIGTLYYEIYYTWWYANGGSYPVWLLKWEAYQGQAEVKIILHLF